MKFVILLLIFILCGAQARQQCSYKNELYNLYDDHSLWRQSAEYPTKQDGPVTDSAYHFDYSIYSDHQMQTVNNYEFDQDLSINFWLKFTRGSDQVVLMISYFMISVEDGNLIIQQESNKQIVVPFSAAFYDWNFFTLNYLQGQSQTLLINGQVVAELETPGHHWEISNINFGFREPFFILDGFQVYYGTLTQDEINCKQSLCSMHCTNSLEYCSKESQYCGVNLGFDPDFENSAKITFIRTYSDQVTSPLKWKTETEHLIEEAVEYGYHYWFKWDYLWRNNYQFDFDYFNQSVELSFLSEYEDSAFESDDYGKRSLCLWLDFSSNNARSLRLGTYDEGYSTNYEQEVMIPQSDFDNQWTYLHYYYSKDEQKIRFAIKFAQQEAFETVSLSDISHAGISADLGKNLYFRLANSHDGHRNPGFQGFYKDVRFTYGAQNAGGYLTFNAIRTKFRQLPSPVKALTTGSSNLTLFFVGDYSSNQTFVQDKALYYPKYNLDYPIEYNIHGWFKLPIGFSASEKTVIYRLSTKNTAKSTSRSQNDLGKYTFVAYIQNNVITFESYSVADLHNPQSEGVSVSYTVSQSQIENDLYFYQGYSKEAGVSVAYIKTYDSSTGSLSQLPSNFNNQVIHMRSADYQIYLGGDGESHINLSEFSCVNFEYGSGSFIANAEDNLAYYKSIEDCVAEGDKDSYIIGQEYSLESYNNPGYYMSHGSPSYLTNSLEFVGNFELVDGLVGDIDTVSLRSTLEIDGEVRENFYWRHSSYVVREMENDGTDLFAADASFLIHKDAFIPGTIALESVNFRGYYIRHRGNVIRLEKLVAHDDYYADASWNVVDGAGGHVPPIQLLPVYRLENPETNDVYLTIHEDKAEAMRNLGYQDFNQPADGDIEETNVIGYAFNKFWDSYTTAIFEFKDLTTQTHYYTTDANDCPEGYTLNIISFYAYPINFERTHPVFQYTDIETETYEWTTSRVEIEDTYSDETSYTYEGKKFWIYGDSEDVCRYNIDKCGPPIPEECEFAYQYRPSQSSECQECFGEIDHYDHSEGDINKFYTATCIPCEGGKYSWNEDEFGNRTCIECPFGTLSNEVCYLHCDTNTYKYLNIETMECTQCDGILQPHPNGVENVYQCILCDRVDMKRECSYDGGQDEKSENIFVIAPNVCPQGTVQVDEFRICSECPLEKDWTLNSDDGIYYCIKTCEDDNHYVNENGQCAPCQNGFIYDDGTGTKKCAPDVMFDPITKGYDDETIEYIYDVPDDQLDDIKEFGFWMWIRPQFLSPKKFDFASATTNDQRIAGFAQIPQQEGTDSSAVFGPETKGLAAYIQSHSDPEQEDEKVVVTSFSTNQQTTHDVLRRDYEYEWNLVFVAQKVATGQMCSYVYSPGQSGNQSFQHDILSEIDLSANSLIFYIGRQYYYNSLTNMGFQGQYYNIELRFGYNGIYQNSAEGVTNYLTSQRQPISQVPVQIVVSQLYEISNQDQYTNLSEVDNEYKNFYMGNLHGTQRYAVYGWFKGSSSRIEKDQVLFNLQDISADQEVTEWGSALKLGDKSLTCYLDSDQTLKFESYSTNAMAEGTYTSTAYTSQTPFSLSQYSNWFYIYLAYDRLEQIAWGYYKNILTQEKYFKKINVSYDFWHFRTDEQILSLGLWPDQDLDTRYKENFEGDVYNIKLQYHDICEYEDEECVGGLAQEHTPTPAPWGQCVIMYDQINFQGNFISVCDKDESYQMEVLSIYIPEGIEFTIWEQQGFQGLTVVYYLSQPNIVEWNFTLLLEGKVKGAKVMKNAAFYSYLQKLQGEKVFTGYVQVSEKTSNNENSESENQSMLQTGSTTAHSMTEDYDMQQFQNLDNMTSKSSISHSKPQTVNTKSTTPEVTNVHFSHSDSSSMPLNSFAKSEENVRKAPTVQINTASDKISNKEELEQKFEEVPLEENKIEETPIDISEGVETIEPQNNDKMESKNDNNNENQQQQQDDFTTAQSADDDDVIVVEEQSKNKNKKNHKFIEADKKEDKNETFEERLDDYYEEEIASKNGLARNHLRKN